MSTPAKDAMIQHYRKEEDDVGPDYSEWLDRVEMQQEWVSRLIADGHIPTPQEERHV